MGKAKGAGGGQVIICFLFLLMAFVLAWNGYMTDNPVILVCAIICAFVAGVVCVLVGE